MKLQSILESRNLKIIICRIQLVYSIHRGAHYLQIAIICPESLRADIISCRHFLQLIMSASKDSRQIMTDLKINIGQKKSASKKSATKNICV